jgi:hypothetical protein
MLTRNQRELVKFMKQYTLITRPPKKGFKSIVVDDVHTPYGDENIKKSPFEDLLDYRPDSNKIDRLLHKAILDDYELDEKDK